MGQVSYGTITITDTNDIESITIEYARNQSTSNPPDSETGGWSTTRPAWAQGYYIWQRARIHKSGTTQDADTFGAAVCLTGSTGQTGNTGAAGRSLTGTETKYTNVASNTTQAQVEALAESNWISNVPSYNSSKPDYWVRIKNTYDKAPLTEYIYYKDNGITDAVKTSNDANATATAANQTANQANQTANQTQTNLDNYMSSNDAALNALQTKTKYFWTNLVSHTNGSGGWTKPNYPVGTYAASGINGTTFDSENSNTYGYNTWYANGIHLRYNAINLGQLTGSALTFYHPSTNTQGVKAMELSGSALKFYASDGITAQAEFGGSKARVSGTINAYDGQIGNSEDNYWYIGNYLDYFENQSAIIKSHGTASIQLGDTDTWRIATNRIHTAWNNDSDSGEAFRLHFPMYDNKYWDSGLHLPTSATDKLLYIRNSSSSNTLTYLNEALEDQYTNRWNYLFYITSNGSLYARNLYVLDDNGNATQIGGTDGVYLLKSGGTMTGSITMSNGGKFIGDLTGNADTATTATTATQVSKNLKIQLNSGTTEGTNQFTYNGSTAKNINITKFSIGLGNVENTALSTWAGSSSLTTTKVGTLAEAATRGVDTSISAASTSTKLPTSAAVAAFVEGKGYITSYVNTTYSLTQDSSNGHKITLTPSSGTAQTITIPDNNTTYTFANGTNGFTVTPSGGTAQTVTVTPSITNNVTGSGTNGYLAKFTGANTIGNGPALSSTGTRYLKEDGTWGTPGGTYSLPTASSSTLGGIKVGSGLSISEGVLSHSDTSSQASSSNSERTYIQSVTLDGYGHVTGLSTATETVTNTHNTAYLYVGKSDGTANAATTNGNTYLILMDGGSATTRRKVSGSGTVSVASDVSGNITITGSAHPTSLKNPNALTVNVYNATTQTTSGYSTTTYDGSVANQSINVAGNNAITKITSNTSGQLVIQRASGAEPETVTVKITATTSDTSASADKLNLSADVGGPTQPVYFDGNTGLPVATTYSLNKTVPSNAVFTDTWIAMVGATSSANGTAGYVSAPPKDGYNTKFLRADGTWVVPGGTYSLPLAANGTRGGVQIGYSANGKNYPVQLSSEKMYVNVPWTDTNNYHKTGSWNGLTYTAAKVGSPDDLAFTLPTASTTVSGVINTSAQELAGLKTGMFAAVHFNTSAANSNGYYKIKINSTTSWMLNFTIRVYQSYNWYDIVVSGYNYPSSSFNYSWYSPTAYLEGSSANSINVYFGKDNNNDLWVAIPDANYTGLGVFNVVNGYTKVIDNASLFTITRVTSLSGTTTNTITAYRPWLRNETVTNATNASAVPWSGVSSKPNLVNTITTTAGTHSAISSATGTVSFNVPTKTSHLTNDSGFVTSSGVTSITPGNGLINGTSGTSQTAITSTGTISLATVSRTNNTSTASPAHSGTFTAIDSITTDSYGRVTAVNTKTVTLPASGNTDHYVSQSVSTTSDWRKILLSYQNDSSATAAVASNTNVVYGAVGISAQPSTGYLRAGGYNVLDKVMMKYDSTLDALVFQFS